MEHMNDTLLQAKEPEMKADEMNEAEMKSIAGGGLKGPMGWYCKYCGIENSVCVDRCRICGKSRF